MQRVLETALRIAVVLSLALCARAALAINAEQLAVVFNAADAESRELAGYYQQQRHIPAQNMIAIDMPGGAAALDVTAFEKFYQQVVAATPQGVQFYALAWSKPYRVACMSITSAFAFGFNKKYCAQGCRASAASAY